MKVDLLSISSFLIITIAIVKAQKYTKLNRPVIDLNPKYQVTTSKLPEERRKLSVFPKSKVKYVVTSKPYSKVRTYSPHEDTTKKLVMQQLVPKDMKNKKTTVTSMPIGKYTTFATTAKRLYTSRSQLITKPLVEDNDFYESNEDGYMQEPSIRHNVAYKSENNLSSFDEKDYADEHDHKELNSTSSLVNKDDIVDLDTIESNGRNKIDLNKTLDPEKKEEENKETGIRNTEIIRLENERIEENEEVGRIKEGIINSENEEINKEHSINYDLGKKEPVYEKTESQENTNNRKKRLSVLRRGGYNVIVVSGKDKLTREDSDVASEKNDRNEFIFIKDYLEVPVDVKKSSNYEYLPADMDDSVEIATEIAWLEEYKPRQ